MLLRGVDRRGGVVEDEHARVGEHGPGDGDALALPARQRVAPLADLRLVAVGHGAHELVGPGQAGGPLDGGGIGVGLGEGDVGGDGVAEEEGVLEHGRHRTAEVAEAHLPHVDAVEQHPAAGHVVEARDQTGDRRLAAAGGADEGDRRAGGDVEVEAVEHGVGEPLRVAERHVVEPHVPAPGRQRRGVGDIDHPRLGGEHVVHPLGGGGGPLCLGEDHPEHAERPDHQCHVGVERRQLADGQLTVDHEVPAVAEHGDEPDVRHQLHGRQVGGPDPHRVHRGVVDVVGLGVEARHLEPLGAEAFHHPNARHRLLHHGGQLRRLLLHPHDGGADPGAEPPAEVVHERQADQGRHRQSDVDGEQHDRRDQDGEEVRDRERDHHEERLHLLEVGVRPRHQLTGLGPVVEAEVELLQVGEEPVAQRGLGRPGHVEGEVAAHPGEDRGDDAGTEDQQRPEEEVAVGLLDALVDGELHQAGHRDLAERPEQAGERAPEGPPAELPDLTEEERPPARRVVHLLQAWPPPRRVMLPAEP